MGNLVSRQHRNNKDQEEQKPSPKIQDPLDLSRLPQEVVHSIAQKFKYKEYANLEQTSRCMTTVLNNCKFSLIHDAETVYVNKKTTKLGRYYFLDYMSSCRKIPWHVATSNAARINAYMIIICCNASSERMKAVTKLFEENKTTTNCLQIMERVTFEPKDLYRLVQVLKVRTLDIKQFLPREFFTNPEEGLNKTLTKDATSKFKHFLPLEGGKLVLKNFKNPRGMVASLVVTLRLYTNGCSDEEFLKMKTLYLHMTNDFITDRGLNRYLMQWKRKERKIGQLFIEFGRTFGRRNFDTILQGLGANLIWSPDMHEYSLVSTIRLEEFQLMIPGDPRHLYSIGRVDSPETFKCRWCEKKFCSHRRRYSVQRLQRFFPRANNAFIYLVKRANTALFNARCVQILLGAAPRPSPLTKNVIKRIYYEEEADLSIFKTLPYILRVYLLNQ